ncbi:hypothetical protein HYS28_03030 [Candidatus Uhrbacteria bacterium]|nr:hypothetical protein [Candidatus Uhrbacteria bacterium]
MTTIVRTFDEAREALARFDAEHWKHEDGMPTVRHVLLHLVKMGRVHCLDQLAVSQEHRAEVYDQAVQRLLENSLRLERAAGGRLKDEHEWLASLYGEPPDCRGGGYGRGAGLGLLYQDYEQMGPYRAVWRHMAIPFDALTTVVHAWEHDLHPVESYAKRITECADMLRDAAFLFRMYGAERADARCRRILREATDEEAVVDILEPLGRRLDYLWQRE